MSYQFQDSQEDESESLFSQPIAFRGYPQPSTSAEHPQYRGQYITNVPQAQPPAKGHVVTQQPAPFNGNVEPLYPAQAGRTIPPFSTIAPAEVLRIPMGLGGSVHVLPTRNTNPCTPEAGYRAYCASVPSTKQDETEIVVYDSDPNHEVSGSDPETCTQDFSPRSPNFTYEDTESTGTRFKKPRKNPWVDGMKWRPGLDVLLLREVQTHALHSLSSADKNLAWNKIYMTLTCDPQVKHLFTKLTSGESCKKRFTKLKGWYKSNDRKNLQKSGTVEEYGEVDKLLGDFVSLENDAKEISSTLKATKTTQEKILLQQGKEIRDSSLGAFAGRSGKGKQPVASTGELVQCLKLFLT